MFEVNEYTVLMTVESLPFGDVTGAAIGGSKDV